MRITDNRYAAEMTKFNLAIRMIGHEARTGTIRGCTGFSEDRIRKIYGTYFKNEAGNTVRRRRGKTPTQIAAFVTSSSSQSEATLLACLFLNCRLANISRDKGLAVALKLDGVTRGERLCDAYEAYRLLQPRSEICFERSWSLYKALVIDQELYFAECQHCQSVYVQDRFALDYNSCPFCELKTVG